MLIVKHSKRVKKKSLKKMERLNISFLLFLTEMLAVGQLLQSFSSLIRVFIVMGVLYQQLQLSNVNLSMKELLRMKCERKCIHLFNWPKSYQINKLSQSKCQFLFWTVTQHTLRKICIDTFSLFCYFQHEHHSDQFSIFF